eukprot:scaffold1976_cov187-Alexandrium_tamarense.AAC.22
MFEAGLGGIEATNAMLGCCAWGVNRKGRGHPAGHHQRCITVHTYFAQSDSVAFLLTDVVQFLLKYYYE